MFIKGAEGPKLIFSTKTEDLPLKNHVRKKRDLGIVNIFFEPAADSLQILPMVLQGIWNTCKDRDLEFAPAAGTPEQPSSSSSTSH